MLPKSKFYFGALVFLGAAGFLVFIVKIANASIQVAAGAEEYKNTIQALASPGGSMNLISFSAVVADGDTVAIRYTMRGTHQGSFAGVPATGKTVVAQSMAFYRLAGGKIVEERAQLDMLGVLQQLGAVPRT